MRKAFFTIKITFSPSHLLTFSPSHYIAAFTPNTPRMAVATATITFSMIDMFCLSLFPIVFEIVFEFVFQSVVFQS